jgi:hypothetical protein
MLRNAWNPSAANMANATSVTCQRRTAKAISPFTR